jgi:hypothetical protein
MGTLKTQPEKRIINGVEKLVSTKVITSEPEYTPSGEFLVITADSDQVLIRLNSNLCDHVIIKAKLYLRCTKLIGNTTIWL